MNTSAWIEALGWTLLHFIWQGALAGVCLWAVLQLARNARPHFRYAVSCAALIASVSMAVGTFARESRAPRAIQRATFPVAIPPGAAPRIPAPPASMAPPIEEEESRPFATSASPPPVTKAAPANSPALQPRFSSAIAVVQKCAPWFVLMWFAGVALCSFRLWRGWRIVQRLRRSGEQSSASILRPRFAALAETLQVRRATELLVSASVRVPMVIGWLKPVVLIPARILTGLPAEQVEAILAHELAHIRRNDYLVNLLQNVVETVFFYHPTVWWISAQIRKEREHCCDDLAAQVAGDPVLYVSALAALEESRADTSALAMAANGGDLLSRARRLLRVNTAEGPTHTWFAGGFALVILACVSAIPLTFLQAADPAPPQSGTSSESTAQAPAKTRLAADVAVQRRRIEQTKDELAALERLKPEDFPDALRRWGFGNETVRKTQALLEDALAEEKTLLDAGHIDGDARLEAARAEIGHFRKVLAEQLESIKRAHRTKLQIEETQLETMEKLLGAAKKSGEAKHEQTREVLKLWRGEYKDAEAVPAEAMQRVAKQVTKFIEQSPGENAEKFQSLLPRLEGDREWPWPEAAAMLDQLCDISTAPVGWTELGEQFRAFNRVKRGAAWPADTLAALPFGPANEQGLRAAWLFEPMQPTYAVGDVLKSRVIFHNAGKERIEFRTDAWHQEDQWHVTDAAGNPVKVKTTWFTGLTPLQRFVLEPGQVAEVPGHGVGIGGSDYTEKYSVGAIGAEIPATPGDELRCVWDVTFHPAGADPNAGAPSRLRTGEVKFRVVPKDENAPQPPGAATAPGRYQVAPGIWLQVTQLTTGKDGEPTKRLNTVTVERSAARERNPNPPQIKLPPGLDSYVLVWVRGTPAVWIGEPSRIRKIDLTPAGAFPLDEVLASIASPAERETLRAAAEKFKLDGTLPEQQWPWDAAGDLGGMPADARAELMKRRPPAIADDAPADLDVIPLAIPRATGAVLIKEGTGSLAKPWRATGRVTDQNGAPVPDVEIWVHSGIGSLFRTGLGKTDKDGRYTVEFRGGVAMEKESAQLQVANITAHKRGWFEKNLNRHGVGAAAMREVPAEDLKGYGVTPAELTLPDKPREVNFVMAPAVTIKGRLVGTGSFPRLPPQAYRGKDEKPVAGHTVLRQSPLARWKVWLTGPTLPPATSVFASAETDADGRFEFSNVPWGYEWEIRADTHQSGQDPRSPLFTPMPETDLLLEVEMDEAQSGLQFLPAAVKADPAQRAPQQKSELFAEGTSPVTALMGAAESGNLADVKRYLAAGEDPNARTSDKAANGALIGGITPLYAAAVGGHVEVAKALLDAGADPQRATTANGRFPLMEIIHAIKDDATLEAMVKLLLERGADPNQRSAKIGSALHFAVVQKKPGVVRQLVAAGAKLDAKTPDGKTPRELARELRHAEMEKLLIELEGAPQPNPPAEGKGAAENRTLLFLDGDTGQPLPGISARLHWLKPNEPGQQTTALVSDEMGMLRAPVPRGNGVAVTIATPGWWTNQWINLVNAPADPKAAGVAPTADAAQPVEVKLWRGTRVTGRLIKPDGSPMPGAALQVGVYINNQDWKKRLGMDLGWYSWDHGDWPNWSVGVLTKDDGTFETTVPPPDARGWVRVGTTELGFGNIAPAASPDPSSDAITNYAPFEAEARGPEDASIGELSFGDLRLERGLVLRGRVVDADGIGLAGVRLMTSGARGPYAGRSTVSGADGRFAFLPMAPGAFTLSPDARLRGPDGQVKSRDVLAVFLPQPVTLQESKEITVRAVPHVELEIDWVDRRAKKGPVSFYGEFTITGRVPREEGESARWRGETELVNRDGRDLLVVKVPRDIQQPTLSLPADKVVTAGYEDPFIKSGPGQVVLQAIGEPVRRTIFGDEPKAQP